MVETEKLSSLQKKIQRLALLAGEILLKNGAEIYRVEDTVERICRSCGIPVVECFATTTGIFLSTGEGEPEASVHTSIKRISGLSIDMDKISRVNGFSRDFSAPARRIGIDEGLGLLHEIDARKPYDLWVNAIGAVLVGAPLSLSFGGSVNDAIGCGIISLLTFLFSNAIDKILPNAFIRIMMSCGLAALLTLVGVQFGILQSIRFVIISAITIFLPGVAMTNATRDLLSGDMLSGVARFAEALVTAVTMASGAGLVLKIWTLYAGNLPSENPRTYPLYAVVIFALLTTMGFCLIFHVPKRHILPASVIGASGYALYYYTLMEYGSVLFSCFLGTMVVAVLAECSSRAGKEVTTIFIIPGIVPIVPGTGMYMTMLEIINGNYYEAGTMGTQTLLAAGSIAMSIVIITSFTRTVMAVGRKIMQRKTPR